ncbi:MAG: hypothetical protein Q8Q30_03340 [Candidatus Woesebacteria bacterium]|nr:hypothetical protein [Candidatus Woesebacteria bacterium]
MTKKDKQSLAGIASKKEIIDLFNQGIEEVILPALENLASKDDVKTIRDEMATKDDIQDLQTQLDSIERKVEANQLRSDQHGQDIEKVKKHFAFA